MLTRDEIVGFDQCDATFDDLVLFSVYIEATIDRWPDAIVPIPEWLTGKYEMVKAELMANVKAYKQRELRRLKAEKETLLSRYEKRGLVEDKIAKLEKDLA